MRKTVLGIILFSLFLLGNSSYGVAAELQSSIGAGYRQDQLSWSIAGDLTGGDPNILSELEWNVESVVVTSDLWVFSGTAGHVSSSGNSRFFLHLQGNYGWIYNGDNRDSDYSGDYRTGEYSRSESTAGDGYVYDMTGTLGWELSTELAPGSQFSAAPLLGYGYSVQQLTMTDGVQVLASSGTPTLGPIAGLDSRYSTEWYGSFAGMMLRYDQCNADGTNIWAFWVEGRHHWFNYRGEAEWNLRTDLNQTPSFDHEAQGTGWTFACGSSVALSKHNSLAVEYLYRQWRADDNGLATFHYTDGSIARTRFNEAEWDSQSVTLQYVYRF